MSGVESDYIDRTIATVRNHRDADNCWPQWANIFADEIEALRSERDALAARVDALEAENARLWVFVAEMSGLISDLGDVPDPGMEDLHGMANVIRRAALRHEDPRGE